MVISNTSTPQRTPPAGSVPTMNTPTTFNPGYPINSGPASTPPNQTQDSMSLPIFNPSTGNSDSGVGHSGDLGGAGAR